jgi:hypothetical protein
MNLKYICGILYKNVYLVFIFYQRTYNYEIYILKNQVNNNVKRHQKYEGIPAKNE